MKICKLILATATIAVLAGCNSSPKENNVESVSSLPNWILNPSAPDGIAATDCVKYSGNISIDKKMATANGRLALAQQIDTRVEGLEKTYSNRTDSNEEITVGSTFTSVSKQLTKQKLQGSRVVRSDVVTIAGNPHYCVLVTMEPSATKELFDEILAQSNRSVNPADEKFLYQEFKAAQAEKDLKEEISRLTN